MPTRQGSRQAGKWRTVHSAHFLGFSSPYECLETESILPNLASRLRVENRTLKAAD
jgi:hypothetical protein